MVLKGLKLTTFTPNFTTISQNSCEQSCKMLGKTNFLDSNFGLVGEREHREVDCNNLHCVFFYGYRRIVKLHKFSCSFVSVIVLFLYWFSLIDLTIKQQY